MNKFKILKRGHWQISLKEHFSYLISVPSITSAVFRAVKNKNGRFSANRTRSGEALGYIKEKLNA